MPASTRYPELNRLDAYRLDNNLSYRQLAVLVDIPFRTLFGLLTKADPNPWDRTLHKIQKFLDRTEAEAVAAAGDAPGARE